MNSQRGAIRAAFAAKRRARIVMTPELKEVEFWPMWDQGRTVT